MCVFWRLLCNLNVHVHSTSIQALRLNHMALVAPHGNHTVHLCLCVCLHCSNWSKGIVLFRRGIYRRKISAQQGNRTWSTNIILYYYSKTSPCGEKELKSFLILALQKAIKMSRERIQDMQYVLLYVKCQLQHVTVLWSFLHCSKSTLWKRDFSLSSLALFIFVFFWK